jgi:two-component system response regulator HydG|tara:strand:- start:2354 stop:3787 length:1434 start_codon:yes stop_codon:yes gene_type:complete
MIKVLYVGDKKRDIPQLSGTATNIDYVQNGMIALSAAQTQDIDVIIIEDQLPLMTPSRLITELVSLKMGIPVVSIVRSNERRSHILDDFGHGLFGWIEPDRTTPEEFLRLLVSAKGFHDFIKDAPRTSVRSFSSIGYMGMVGVGEEMLKIYHLLIQIKNKDVTTVLFGESGTGKNLTAKTLHEGSLRRDRPNVSVNCPAIPSELLESELFGHEKGAFTGAIERKDGKFLTANAGTIFLDEIGDMSPSLQAKILRVLESGEIERVGGAETIKVDVRVISATNQDLDEKIRKGEFRQDLLHRINVFPITIPPLRAHPDDIPLMAMSILKKLTKKHKTPVKYISPEGMNLLRSFPWVGNVRELENTLERVVLINDIPILTEKEIGPILDESTQVKLPRSYEAAEPVLTPDQAPSPEAAPVTQEKTIDTSAIKTLKELEYEAVIAGLSRTNWNMTQTAQQLGISRMTLYRKLDQHGLRNKD